MELEAFRGEKKPCDLLEKTSVKQVTYASKCVLTFLFEERRCQIKIQHDVKHFHCGDIS